MHASTRGLLQAPRRAPRCHSTGSFANVVLARAATTFARPRRNTEYDPPREPRERKYVIRTSNKATNDDIPIETIRLDKVTSEQVKSLWPPLSLVDGAPQDVPGLYESPHACLDSLGERPVFAGSDREVLPPLWLDTQSVSSEDVGSFVKVNRDKLLELLPEGPCGELARDLTLIPSRKAAIGLMLRKATVELMMQLSEARDATNVAGEPRISKAGFLLDGHRGVGKSQILNTIAMWAREQGWLVVLEPTAGRYRTEIADIKRSNNGIYIQNEFAQQFLEATSIANREKLEEIPIDMSVYGSRALDGEPAKEARRQYNELIEKNVEHETEEQGFDDAEALRRIEAYRKQIRLPSMAQQMSDPMTVWDIVEFGLENPAYATQAVAELMAQLQRQVAHPVLVIVDQWNECFPVSQYVSIRYDNTRYHGYIPAYHLSMPRALHEWDGHKYRRGLKICATSWFRYRRRDYRPDLLGVKQREIRTIRNFTQHEFANYVAYMRKMNVLHNFPVQDLEYYYMLSQGNGFQARTVLSTLY